jgi:hypothetical protein
MDYLFLQESRGGRTGYPVWRSGLQEMQLVPKNPLMLGEKHRFRLRGFGGKMFDMGKDRNAAIQDEGTRSGVDRHFKEMA